MPPATPRCRTRQVGELLRMIGLTILMLLLMTLTEGTHHTIPYFRY